MKTYCKPASVDIESEEFNAPAVMDAFSKKMRRNDHKKVLKDTGIVTEADIARAYLEKDDTLVRKAKEAVNADITKRIQDRDLKLKPIKQFTRIDGLTHKQREICQECVDQQVMEYIAVHALEELFRVKFLDCQYGSVPGKGQVAGKRKIERLLRRKHPGKIDVVKCDVHKAYPSVTVECVMKLLKRDVGKNKVLLWYLEALMENYPNGHLCIGGYLPSWLFNYVMSYVLRHLQSQYQERRGVRKPLVLAMVCYADDFSVFGRQSQLVKALKKTMRWSKSTLGLKVKQAWQIYHIAAYEKEKEVKAQRAKGSKKRTAGVDMMGYAVYRTYTIIRGRVYRRMRRQFMRAWKDVKKYGYLPHWRARKLSSYKGWIKHSNSLDVINKYCLKMLFKALRRSISIQTRKENKEYEQRMLCIAAA